MKTKRGTVEVMANWATGSWRHEIAAIVRFVAKSGTLMNNVGFMHPDGQDTAEHLRQEDMDLAEWTLKVLMALAARRIITCMSYTWSLPGRFAQLVHPEEGVQQAGLRILERWCEVLWKAEAAAATNPFLKSLLET